MVILSQPRQRWCQTNIISVTSRLVEQKANLQFIHYQSRMAEDELTAAQQDPEVIKIEDSISELAEKAGCIHGQIDRETLPGLRVAVRDNQKADASRLFQEITKAVARGLSIIGTAEAVLKEGIELVTTKFGQGEANEWELGKQLGLNDIKLCLQEDLKAATTEFESLDEE